MFGQQFRPGTTLLDTGILVPQPIPAPAPIGDIFFDVSPGKSMGQHSLISTPIVNVDLDDKKRHDFGNNSGKVHVVNSQYHFVELPRDYQVPTQNKAVHVDL